MFPAKRGFLNGNLDIESHIYLFNLKSIATKETQTALKMHCMFIAWSKIQKYWLYVFFFLTVYTYQFKDTSYKFHSKYGNKINV